MKLSQVDIVNMKNLLIDWKSMNAETINQMMDYFCWPWTFWYVCVYRFIHEYIVWHSDISIYSVEDLDYTIRYPCVMFSIELVFSQNVTYNNNAAKFIAWPQNNCFNDLSKSSNKMYIDRKIMTRYQNHAIWFKFER